MILLILDYNICYGYLKNRLNERVLLSTQNTCLNCSIRQYSQLYADFFCLFIFSSAEPNALGELIGWESSWCPCVHPFTLSDMNISETSWPIIIKFHLKHHWGGGLAALGFGPDGIRTLVSIAFFPRDIMGKIL